ncbi:MAG: glycosyltransferase [Solirubrobacterales bacterium]|nr:glycosyltransferase [Solirubrobacterales bacterium]
MAPASIVEDGRTGWLVPPGDVAALAAAITHAAGDADERRRRGRLARAAVCERLSWSVAVAQLASVLAEVAQCGGVAMPVR